MHATLDADVPEQLLEECLAACGLELQPSAAEGGRAQRYVIRDNVRITQFVGALARAGLTLSNVAGGGLRIHRAETLANVIDLQQRRDARTDAQMRRGFSALFDPSQGVT